MSLEEPTVKPETQKSKKQQARDLALKYKDLMYHQARAKLMEEIPCSRSTATKALKWFEKQQKEEKAVKPSIEVAAEEKKKPEFLPEAEIVEIEVEEPITKVSEEAAQEQLAIFQDMLRGLHILIFGEGGIVDLLVKAGRPEKQVKEVSDQLYRWLTRRYTVEDLEKFDTILLVGSYGILIGSIAKDVISNRGKKKETKKT